MTERRALVLSALVTGAAIPGFFIIFGLWSRAGLAQMDAFDPLKVAAFARLHPALYGALPVLGVVMHLAALVLVVGLHARLATASPLVARAATAMGVFWVAADVLQNLMHYGIFLGGTPDAVVPAASRVTDALWHAGHFGGGLWVLAVAAIGGAMFSRPHRLMAAVAGVAFALHPFVVPLWPSWFAAEFVLVPVWAFWTAAAIGRGRPFAASAAGRSLASAEAPATVPRAA